MIVTKVADYVIDILDSHMIVKTYLFDNVDGSRSGFLLTYFSVKNSGTDQIFDRHSLLFFQTILQTDFTLPDNSCRKKMHTDLIVTKFGSGTYRISKLLTDFTATKNVQRIFITQMLICG